MVTQIFSFEKRRDQPRNKRSSMAMPSSKAKPRVAIGLLLIIATSYVHSASLQLSRFAQISKNIKRAVPTGVDKTSYTLGAYGNAAVLSGYNAMMRGDAEESEDELQAAAISMGVFDTGQGTVQPVAGRILDIIIKKHKKEFAKTLDALGAFKDALKSAAFSKEFQVGQAWADVVGQHLVTAKMEIAQAFEEEASLVVKANLKNTQIYSDLVTSLKNVKTWARALKWADVFAGPLFDALTIAYSIWQLDNAIKEGNTAQIVSNSLGIVAGVVGITTFAIAAFAAAGSALVIAGPIGAAVAAVLGITAAIIEIIDGMNIHKVVDAQKEALDSLRETSLQMLNITNEQLPQMVLHGQNFSWVYQVNQGHWINFIKGRDYDSPLDFTASSEPTMIEDDTIAVGPMRMFDKSKYGSNIFWKPEGIEELGYDFYGKKMITEEFKGCTLFLSTNLVANKGVELRGADIKTWEGTDPGFPDHVIVDDFTDLGAGAILKVKTGKGNDVLLINGFLRKVGDENVDVNSTSAKDRQMNIAWPLWAWLAEEVPGKDEYYKPPDEVNLLSLSQFRNPNRTTGEEGEVVEENLDTVTGIFFKMRVGTLMFIMKKEKKWWSAASIKGVNVFVGSRLDDTVVLSMKESSEVYERFGKNTYMMECDDWGYFHHTINDKSPIPGTIVFQASENPELPSIRYNNLAYDADTKTLEVWSLKSETTWQLRGKITYKRDLPGEPTVQIEGVRGRALNTFGEFRPPELYEKAKENAVTSFKFDRSFKVVSCAPVAFEFKSPLFSNGAWEIWHNVRTMGDDRVILGDEFVQNCLLDDKRSVILRGGRFPSTYCERCEGWVIEILALPYATFDKCKAKEVTVRLSESVKRLTAMINGEEKMLVDLVYDNRKLIDLFAEYTQQQNTQNFAFKEDIQGSKDPDRLVLMPIEEPNGPPAKKKSLNVQLRKGKRYDMDTVVITNEFLEYLFESKRYAILVRSNKTKTSASKFLVRIYKDKKILYEAALRNVENIVRETNDNHGFPRRVPIFPDLQVETRKEVNIYVEAAEVLKQTVLSKRIIYDCEEDTAKSVELG